MKHASVLYQFQYICHGRQPTESSPATNNSIQKQDNILETERVRKNMKAYIHLTSPLSNRKTAVVVFVGDRDGGR